MLDGDRQALEVALDGRYTIERELGAGGMATVYLADDVRHSRKVALKVLRPDLAATLGAERFLAEIRTTANFQHPHILPLHDSGTVAGFLYYVMPYVQGESLRDRLVRERQLPIEDAVRMAREVADALSHAHEHGVIHRDIKPENILLQGTHAVVADFGIALAVEQASSSRVTQTGMSLGTPQYMAPEQAMGERTIDARADVYALGAVTYEMLTGEPPFTGTSAQSIVAKVITQRPTAPRALRDAIPEHVEAAVLTALAKLPADRFATTAEFASAIGTGRSTTTLASPPVARRPRVASAAIGAAVLLGALAIWGWMRPPEVAPAAQRRFSVVLPDSAPLMFLGPTAFAAGQRSLALSPDGRWIVYMGSHAGSTSLYLRDLATFAITRIAGTERAYYPFFSPDGRSIGFFVGNDLRRVDVAGGPISPVATIDVPTGAAWGSDGHIVVSELNGQALVRVAEAGGRPQRIAGDEARRRFPALLPGTPYVLHSYGRRLAATNTETGATYLLTADGPVLASDAHDGEVLLGSAPAFIKAGYLLWMGHDGTLLAARFDPGTLRFMSRVLAVATGVRRESGGLGGAQFAVSDNGMLAYVTGVNADIGHLAWVYEGGATDSLPFVPGLYWTTDVSPDGRRMVGRLSQSNGRLEEWIFDFERGVAQQLPARDDLSFSTSPRWTPDSRHLVYGASETLTSEMFILRVSPDRPSALDTLGRSAAGIDGPAFTASGDTMVVSAFESGATRLMLLGIEPRSGLVPVGNARGIVANPGISPNGKWLTYNSDENTDRQQVFAEPFPPNGQRIQITNQGGAEPVWAMTGDALFYRWNRRIYRVPVAPSGENPFGTPRVFAEGEFAEFGGRTYSVHPDGKRVLVKMLPSERSAAEIRVHTNLVAELQRLEHQTR